MDILIPSHSSAGVRRHDNLGGGLHPVLSEHDARRHSRFRSATGIAAIDDRLPRAA
jgi:hypothetical protein